MKSGSTSRSPRNSAAAAERNRRGQEKKRRPLEECAIGYVRVSTEEQARQGVSLDAQMERIRAYCTLSGLELVQVISEEGVSGAKKLETRPGGAELVGAIAHKAAGHVVALKLDRLFRDAEDALKQTKGWDRAGVALHLIDMGGQTVSTASAMGRMMLTMMAAFAELERNLIAERTSAAIVHMKRQRQVYGPVPMGFRKHGEQLREDKAEAAVVDRIRAWRKKGWTLRKIAETLNQSDVARKRGGRQWYASTVGKILANDIHYRGKG